MDLRLRGEGVRGLPTGDRTIDIQGGLWGAETCPPLITETAQRSTEEKPLGARTHHPRIGQRAHSGQDRIAVCGRLKRGDGTSENYVHPNAPVGTRPAGAMGREKKGLFAQDGRRGPCRGGREAGQPGTQEPSGLRGPGITVSLCVDGAGEELTAPTAGAVLVLLVKRAVCTVLLRLRGFFYVVEGPHHLFALFLLRIGKAREVRAVC